MQMHRLFAIVLICLFQFQAFSAFAGDSTSFNPVPIQVTAKSAGGGVPVGTIIAWPVSRNPSDMENWLECNGQYVNASVYPELAALVGGRVPDFRGLFLRGVGGNSAALGVQQGDMVGKHNHYVNITWSIHADWQPPDDLPVPEPGGDRKTLDAGDGIGVETRPINKAVRYFVRALP